MRPSLLFFAGALSCTASLSAQECAAPAPCVCAPRMAAPTAPPPTNERFLRGPAPGSATGESNSLGIRGPALHIPEMRFGLPHLELPSLYKIRHDASKVFEATRSPLVNEPALELDNVGPALQGPAPAFNAPQPCAPYCPPACSAPVQCTAVEEQLKLLNQKLARLEAVERELVTIKQQQQAAISAQSEVAAATAAVEAAEKSLAAAKQRAETAAAAPKPMVRLRPLQPASYEEPANEQVATTPRKPQTLRGAGENIRQTEGGGLGEWSSKPALTPVQSKR